MNKLVLLSCLLVLPLLIKAQFIKLNTQTNYSITEIVALDDTLAVATTDQRMILRTTDGGTNWTAIHFPFTTPFRSIDFPSHRSGYIMNDSFIYRSTDTGKSWNKLKYYPYDSLIDIDMLNDSTGSLLYKNKDFMKDYQVVKTENYFKNYEEVYFGYMENTYMKLKDMFVTVDGPAYIAADSAVLYARVKGYKTAYNGKDFNAVYAPSKKVAYAAADHGVIVKTENGGDYVTVWQVIENFPEVNLHDIRFTTNDTGYVVGDSGFIMRTYNGGKSWYQLPSGTLEKLNCIDVVNDSIIYVSGENGLILKSVNRGGPGNYLSVHEQLFDQTNPLQVFPNPSSDFITIRLNEMEEFNIELYSMTGKKHRAMYCPSGVCQMTISDLPSGIYIIVATTEIGKQFYAKVIISE